MNRSVLGVKFKILEMSFSSKLDVPLLSSVCTAKTVSK